MKYLKILFILLLILSLSFSLASTISFAQEAEGQQETELVDEEVVATGDIESTSIWALVGQAGNIQYPIYGILIVGLFLISLRAYELYADNQKQAELLNTSFRHLSLNEITSKLTSQPDYLLSRIMAKLINVFETNRNAEHLHDEITNYNSIQHDNFNSFKNRVNFLSDTAGALGLLGTVWGMFIVFSSGTLERDVILYGMGIALMSTLLGLVVSIILDFCATLTDGYFSKHLEKVTSKADELRFRLIELSDSSAPLPATQTVSVSPRQESPLKQNNLGKTSVSNNKKEEKKEPEKVNEPSKLLVKSEIKEAKAGEIIDNLEVQLMGTLDGPVSNKELEVLVNGGGKINGHTEKATIKTDTKGIALFSWKVTEETGEKHVIVRCADEEYKKVKEKLSVVVKALDPESLKLLNNHQAGQTGSELQKPITVLATDKFDNPVKDEKVLMKVTMGNGKFENGSKEITTETNDDGIAVVNFTLGTEPGFNAVDITLLEHDITKSFQAVGQEVTV